MVGEKAILCDCAIESRIHIALPPRYWKARLEDFSGPLVKPVLDWLGSPTDGLFVTGPCGRGKTHLAAAMTRHLILGRIPVKFLRCADLFRDIRAIFQSHSPTAEEDLLGPLEKVRFLILDDLGAGSLSDCERRYTLDLLDTRANKMLPTVITSNWGIDQIEKLMDERIASRVNAFAYFAVGGEDRRAA